MLKTLLRGARPARRRRPANAPPTAGYGCTAPPRRAARATTRLRRRSSSRTRLNKPGSEKETWHIEFDLAARGLDYAVGDSFGVFPTNDPALADAVIRALDAPPDAPIGGRTLREVLIDGVSLVARARHAVPADLLSHRRRRGGRRRRRWRRARIRTAMPRRSTCWPRWRNSPACGPIRKPSSRRSSRCSRASTRSRRRPRAIPAACRSRSMRCATTIGGRTRLGVASTFLADRVAARRPAQGLCAEGARLRPAGRSGDADHHGRPGHRHRAVPRLPARAHGDQGARPQLAVLRPPAARLRLLLRGRAHRHAGAGRAHAALARLVARRRGEILRAGPHARGRPRPLGLARRRRARLRLRRRQAHGQGRRARAGRHRGAARRALDRRGDRLRGRAQEAAAATSRTSTEPP